MCVGVPAQLIGVTGIVGLAADGAAIDLSLTPYARPGDWVLTHLGAARAVIAEAEARLTQAALAGLAAVMAGGDAGDAFADLDQRSPTLPPHLAAALAAGQTTG